MKIVLFCASLYSGKGGMEKTAVTLANYLAKSHKIYLIYYNSSKSESFHLDDSIKIIQWDKHTFNAINKRRNQLLEISPDCCIFFYTSCTIIQHIALFYQTNIPLILHEGTNPRRLLTLNWAIKKNISVRQAFIERNIILSRANYIRLMSPCYINSIPEELRDNVYVFPNFFTRITKEALMINYSKEHNRIINIGGLKENKNIYPLINAFKILYKKFPAWELSIFATSKEDFNSSYAKKLFNYVASELADSKITFHYPVEDINTEYQHSQLHVITSLSEGLPNCVCEAMCNGIPSIGFENCEGTNFLINNTINGFLVKDEQELTDKLELLMINYQLRKEFGIKAWEKSICFDDENIFQLWLEMINKSQQNRYTEELPQYKQYKKYQENLFQPFYDKKYIIKQNLLTLLKKGTKQLCLLKNFLLKFLYSS